MTPSVSLSICGEVERPVRLTLAELRSLADAELVADFHCLEGWSRPGERWRGVRLPTLLSLVGAADSAGYVTVGSGEYTAVLTREQASDERVLLAIEHEGAVSPRRPGYPRLVGPSEWDCFLSVKSVDQIEVTRQPEQATAAAIALARVRATAAAPARDQNHNSQSSTERIIAALAQSAISRGDAPPIASASELRYERRAASAESP